MPYLSVKLFLACPRPTFFLLDPHFRTIFILKRFFCCDFHFCFPFSSPFSTLFSQLLHNRFMTDLVSTLSLRNHFVFTPFEAVFTSKAFPSVIRFVSQTLIHFNFFRSTYFQCLGPSIFLPVNCVENWRKNYRKSHSVVPGCAKSFKIFFFLSTHHSDVFF